MDAYRPKRPTTLALFSQLEPQPRTQPRTQDTINNNSFGKKDSWKDSHSSSPHITGDLSPPEAPRQKQKAEDKAQQHNDQRAAPKPPARGPAPGPRNKPHGRPASDPPARQRDRQPAPGATTTTTTTTAGPRAQRRAGGVGRGGGAAGMRERNQEESSRGRNGGGKEERRGGRLCMEARNAKEKERERSGKERERSGSHQRSREENGPKGNGGGGGGGGRSKSAAAPRGAKKPPDPQNHPPAPSQDIYLTAMVVPRTPVTSRTQDKTQDKTQDQGKNQNGPSQDRQTNNMSRSSSEGGSNRMSLSSDTEGPPPGPLHPPLPDRTNPVISEEEGDGDQNLPANIHNGTTRRLGVHDDRQPVDSSVSGGREAGGLGGERRGGGKAGGVDPVEGSVPSSSSSEAAAGLSYDSVKYTLVVDEHAQLELVSIKNCYRAGSYSDHHAAEDSDTETVYQSANEEEDPEYVKEERRKEEEKRRREEERRQVRRTEEERRRKEEEKRRVEAVKFVRPSKVTSTTSEEEESSGGRGGAVRSKKFLNLFVNGGSHYSSDGAESFGMFSCLLDGVEREQSHRAVYRFVPRHSDELDLEADDPVLMLTQSEDLWCQGYNMRTGATGIFPAYYAVTVTQDGSRAHKDGWMDRFFVRFLGSVQVPFHKGNDVLCAAMQKIAYNRRVAMQPPSACVLEITIKGLKMSVQDQCHSSQRGDKCFHFFQLKNISFCGCHPKYNKYFGFITKHPDQQRFACHVVISEMTSLPLAESVGRAFQQYYKEHVGYSCPTEDIFIE